MTLQNFFLRVHVLQSNYKLNLFFFLKVGFNIWWRGVLHDLFWCCTWNAIYLLTFFALGLYLMPPFGYHANGGEEYFPILHCCEEDAKKQKEVHYNFVHLQTSEFVLFPLHTPLSGTHYFRTCRLRHGNVCLTFDCSGRKSKTL